MADVNVTFEFTIPSADVATAVTAIVRIYPNTEVDEQGDPLYTNGQWVKEKYRRWIQRHLNATIEAGMEAIAQDGAGAVPEVTVT